MATTLVKPAREDVWGLGIPLALTLAVFARSVSFPFVNWDDPSHLLDNPLAAHPLAHGLGGLFWTREIGYPAPFLLLSFALDRVMFGLAPGPYHAENVLLHLANVAMLYAFVRRMRFRAPEACGVATLFAIHPLVVEPVCWVTGRKDVLATALVLAAAHVAAGSRGRDELRGEGRWIAVNVLLMVVGLVLPRMVVAPVLVLLLVHAVRPGWDVRRIAVRVAPAMAFVLGVVFLGARQVAELGAVPARRWTDVPLDMAGAWALQLGHVVFPVDLLAYYFREPGDPSALEMVVAVLAALAGVGFAILRPSWQDAPVRTGALLTVVAWAPVSCAFRIVRWTADSYMYFPLACLGIAVVPLVARAWPEALAPFGKYAALALAIIIALLSFAGTARYASSTSLWAGSIARYPDEPLSWEHEGLGLLQDGHTGEANVLFRHIAERFPDWQDTYDDEVRAYEALGDEVHAHEVLARGMRDGSAACVRMYWMRLLAAPALPPQAERDLVARAFEQGFGPMKVGLHDPAQFRRVADILEAEGLEGPATQARAHAALLERAQPAP